MSALQILQQYGPDMLRGLRVTFALCLIIWSSGILLGSALGLAAAKWPRAVAWPLRVVSLTLAGIPILVFLFWMHYPLQSILGIVVDPFATAALALSIVNVFLVADLVRSVVSDFPTQYLQAARVCGLSQITTLFRIQCPIILRQILPGLLIIQITMLQATLFASLISVDEIFRVAQRINSQVYRPVPIYTLLAVFFVATCVPLFGLAHYLRVRFTRDLSER